jgi:hypothetical protein
LARGDLIIVLLITMADPETLPGANSASKSPVEPAQPDSLAKRSKIAGEAVLALKKEARADELAELRQDLQRGLERHD